MSDEQEQLTRLEEKLDTVIRLLALAISPESQPLKDRARRLQRAGLAPKEMAALFDTTPNTVSVVLAKAKKGKRRNNRE